MCQCSILIWHSQTTVNLVVVVHVLYITHAQVSSTQWYLIHLTWIKLIFHHVIKTDSSHCELKRNKFNFATGLVNNLGTPCRLLPPPPSPLCNVEKTRKCAIFCPKSQRFVQHWMGEGVLSSEVSNVPRIIVLDCVISDNRQFYSQGFAVTLK